MATSPLPRSGNRLLAHLPQADYDRLAPHLQPIDFEFKRVIYEADATIDTAYFPHSGTLSAVTVMEDGSMIEVATIGNEGAVGLPALMGGEISANRIIVQVPGEGVRIQVEKLRERITNDGPLRRMLGRYHDLFMMQASQSVACNGLHSVQRRCCRWLLLTHDRTESDEITLTHEFLGVMLGVRRSSVTNVLYTLQGRGLIRYNRGKITILDRKGLEAQACECYQRIRDRYDRLMN